jgi:DNA repair protein RecN (Recombination protein N)
MLNHLAISNFTTVDSLELDCAAGLTTITGETGAGKSVMLDALALALGGRGQVSLLRDDNRQAEIAANFHIGSDIKSYLKNRDLLDNDNGEDSSEVLLRRVIKPDGRSRAYINGSAVKLGELAALGEKLVDLHGQHEHQSLLNKASHLQILDDYAANAALKEQVKHLAAQCQSLQSTIAKLRNNNADKAARLQLLEYQVTELDQLAVKVGEHSQLENEQKKLSNAQALLHDINHAAQLCDNEQNSGGLSKLQQALQTLKQASEQLPELGNAIELLDSACIQVLELGGELEAISSSVVPDNARLADVEARLDTIYSIARKHNVHAADLFDLHSSLTNELATLQGGDERIEQLDSELADRTQDYLAQAQALSKTRKKAAKQLTAQVNKKLASLQMKHCDFSIALHASKQDQLAVNGLETAELMISTVPGKPPQALAKIASGGELSRVSLAIQVVTAQTSNVPSLVFDEVDVGIGGGVAEVVGNLLRELGKCSQVFCVTHLAQVAAKGQQHLLVSKRVSKKSATTSIQLLDNTARKAELARMISGLDVTDSTRAHAKELLESA